MACTDALQQNYLASLSYQAKTKEFYSLTNAPSGKAYPLSKSSVQKLSGASVKRTFCVQLLPLFDVALLGFGFVCFSSGALNKRLAFKNLLPLRVKVAFAPCRYGTTFLVFGFSFGTSFAQFGPRKIYSPAMPAGSARPKTSPTLAQGRPKIASRLPKITSRPPRTARRLAQHHHPKKTRLNNFFVCFYKRGERGGAGGRGPGKQQAARWVRVAHCSNQGFFGVPLGAPQNPGRVLNESIELRYKKRKANVTKKLKL